MPARIYINQNAKYFRLTMSLIVLCLLGLVVPSFALDPQASSTQPLQIPVVPLIEATNYAIPANAIFVDQNTGKDSNAGSKSSPFLTLNQAISKASDNSTIVVGSGIYREGELKFWKNLTIQAAPNSQVWFDGTQPTSGWTADSAGGFKLINSPSNGLCTAGTGCLDAPDQVNPNYPMAWSPQMVFVNDVSMKEVSTRAQASSGNNFFYDIANNALYIGLDPTGKKVEVTTKRKFADITSPTGAIKGIGIRRYGSILAPSNVQGSYHGAATQLSQGGSGRPNNFTFENNTFFQNASRGLSISYTDNTKVIGNSFLSNGSNGFDVFQTNNALIEKNLIRDNNKESFAIENSASAVIAGSKMVKVHDSIVRNNIVEYNNGTGIWCDLACTGMKYYGNVIRSNAKHGIFYELSDNGTIASNLIYNNKGEGIKIASPNAKIVNNTLVDNGNNIAIYEDPRRVTASDPYADTRNNIIVNNILSSSGNSTTNRLLEINGFNNPDSVVPALMVGELNYNAYSRENPEKPFTMIGYRGSSVSKTFAFLGAAQAEGIEKNGVESRGTSQPIFVDKGRFNFRVSPYSNLTTGSKKLTGSLTYIADDLNVSPFESYAFGAIQWQSMPNPTGTQPTTPTIPPTTPTVPPTTPTIPPTVPPVASPQDIAVRKMISDHNLSKVKVFSFDKSVLKVRAYLPFGGLFHIAADVSAIVDAKGNYQITSVNWIVSFTPIN